MVKRYLCLLVVALTAATTLATARDATASGATQSRTAKKCLTKTQSTSFGTSSLYTVCLSAWDVWDGLNVSGHVAGYSCAISSSQYDCYSARRGSYWYSSLGAWEDWLNYEIVGPADVECVYLRVDTKPTGATSYQSFIVYYGPQHIVVGC
jgi:hypothetical protein